MVVISSETKLSLATLNVGDPKNSATVLGRKFRTQRKSGESREKKRGSRQSVRQSVDHTYHNYCPGHKYGGGGSIVRRAIQRRERGGVASPFPLKLHSMLDTAKAETFDNVVSWQPHGRCFKVRNPDVFVAKVMPQWFHQTKFTSFQRQLNLYGFSRLTTGPDQGA